ncbi:MULTISPECIES: tail fiber assembly protein [Pantoea]|uniref:tail fiber assembly protein n=1 Tax=Pantoea TaxID=53335 RepID=UPI0035E45360
MQISRFMAHGCKKVKEFFLYRGCGRFGYSYRFRGERTGRTEKYRVLLNRINTNDAPDVQWPEAPF